MRRLARRLRAAVLWLVRSRRRLARSPGVWGVALAAWSAAWSAVAGEWLGVLGFAVAGCYAAVVAWQEWELDDMHVIQDDLYEALLHKDGAS